LAQTAKFCLVDSVQNQSTPSLLVQ